MATKAAPPRKFARLSDRKLLSKAARLARLRKLSKSCDRVAGEEQAHILAEMDARGAKTLTLGDTTITRVQQKPAVSYDEDGLWGDLKPAQRRLVYVERIDLALLPQATRDAVVAGLSAADRRTVTCRWLDAAALEQAVSAGRVPAALVKARRTVAQRAASVKVTDPPAK